MLRDGQLVGTLEGDAINHDAMVKLMVGRDLKVAYTPPAGARGEAVLSAQQRADLDLSRSRRSASISIAARSSASPASSAPAAPNLRAPSSASIRRTAARSSSTASRSASRPPPTRSRPASSSCPRTARATGILLDLPIAENISLPNLPAYARGVIVSREAEREQAETEPRRPRYPHADVSARTGSLSGGNQQKVVLAKWLAMKPKVIIFDEPTRGIDVGAKSEIYRLMRELADAGVAC